MNPANEDRSVAVIGGGPAGLMAAEIASAAGLRVRPLRRDGLLRAQVPARRQGRPQSDPRRGLRRFRLALWRAALASRAVAADVRCRCVARLGPQPRRGNIRRQFGPRVSERHEGRPADACLAASPARAGRAVSHAAPLPRLGSGWFAAFRDPGRRARRAGRCSGAGARGRQLGKTRFGRRMGAVAGWTWCVGGAAGAVELRLRHSVERALARSLCRRAGEVGEAAAAGRRGRTHR